MKICDPIFIIKVIGLRTFPLPTLFAPTRSRKKSAKVFRHFLFFVYFVFASSSLSLKSEQWVVNQRPCGETEEKKTLMNEEKNIILIMRKKCDFRIG